MYFFTIVAYILILLYVGARKAKTINNQADFALAGRNLSTFVLVGTLLATWIGTGSIFGNAEETCRVGVAAFAISLSEVFGFLALILLAARIRRTGQMTVQDLLEIRYGVTARVLGTITLIMAYVIIVSYQYRAGAAVIERLLPEGMASQAGIHALTVVGFAIVVILYTALAGMFSVAYTDVANGILMTAGVAIALPIVFFQAGGFVGLREALPASHQQLIGPYSLTDYIGILFPTFLLLLGDANIYTRFFSAREPRSARRSAMILLVGVVILETAIIALALVGSVLHPHLKNPGHVIVEVAFHSLPPVVGALLVATIVAIIVSTADSYLLAPSSALVRDVYQRFLSPNATDRQLVLMSRLVVILFGCLAIGLAFTSDRFFRIYLFAYTIYGVGITPPLVAAFLWKRANSIGAVSGIFSGVATALVWKICNLNAKGWNLFGLSIPPLDAVIPAFFFAMVVLVIVSLLTPPPRKESWAMFFDE